MSLIIIFVMAALLYVLQSVVYSIWGSKGLQAQVWFERGAVTEGENGILVEQVSNAKWLPMPVVHLLMQTDRELVFNGESRDNTTVSDQNYRIDVYSIMPWQKITRRLRFCAAKRGYYPVRELSLEYRNLFFQPFSSFQQPADTWLYVYPRPVFTQEIDMVVQKLMGEVLIRRRLLEDPYAFYGIREYQTYDTMRQINWKATAKTGELRVNTCQSTVSCRVSILLDVRPPHTARAMERVEQGIRMAAAFGISCEEAQIPFSLFTNGTSKGNSCQTDSYQQDFWQEEDLEASTGAGHLQSFMEILSRIDVSAASEWEPKLMEQDSSEDSFLVYISPDDGEPFAECQGFLDCFWIAVKEEDLDR